MKKILFSITSAAAFAGLIAVPVAGASSGLTIDTPVPSSTIGNSVTFGGYASVPPNGTVSGNTQDGSECSGPTTIRFTDSAGQVAYGPADDTDQSKVTQSGKRWTITVDLSREALNQTKTRAVALKAGSLKVYVASQAAGCEATVTYNYQPSAAAAQTPAETPTATPTPTLTPSASPTPAAAATRGTISPLTVFLIGALLGAALLSLAEVSAVSYLKKHGKKPQK